MSRPITRFILRWLFIGWWAVPLLAILAIVVTVLDGGGWWDGEKWNNDPDLLEVFFWSVDKLETFFKVNPSS